MFYSSINYQTIISVNPTQSINKNNQNPSFYIGLIGVVFGLIGLSAYLSSLLSRKEKSNSISRKEETKTKQIQNLLDELRSRKKYAIEHYEHNIDKLIETVKRISISCQQSTEMQFLQELENTNLAGFGKKEKIEEFNRNKLEPLFEREWLKYQEKLQKLGQEFFYTEKKLENDLENILHDLQNNCRKLRVGEPELEVFITKNKLANQLLSSLNNSNKLALTSTGTIASCAALFGFFPSDALADGAGHSVAHGAGHGMAHGVGHGVAHGAGHGMAHGLAHGVGHGVAHGAGYFAGMAVPILNIALISFSLFRFGNFLFNDSEIKEEVKEHTINQIRKSYRKSIQGDTNNLGLEGQILYIKDEFRKQKQKIFDESVQPTLNSVIEQLKLIEA